MQLGWSMNGTLVRDRAFIFLKNKKKIILSKMEFVHHDIIPILNVEKAISNSEIFMWGVYQPIWYSVVFVPIRCRTTISVESVGPQRHNYKWFFPAAHFNFDPHRHTDSTIELNIKTGGGKGNCILIQKIMITISSHSLQKSISECCKRMNGAR